jgi:hypothetical protein
MAKKDHTNEEHKIFVKNEEGAPDNEAAQPNTVEPNDQATGEGDDQGSCERNWARKASAYARGRKQLS